MIKVGDILKSKNTGKEIKIVFLLENTIIGNIYCVVYLEQFLDPDEVIWYSQKELDTYFDFPKEKWMPENQAEYWYVGNDGDISRSIFKGIFDGEMRCKFGNCFATCKEAEAYKRGLEETKEELSSWKWGLQK